MGYLCRGPHVYYFLYYIFMKKIFYTLPLYLLLPLTVFAHIDEELGYVQLFSFILIYFSVKLVNQQPTETVASN